MKVAWVFCSVYLLIAGHSLYEALKGGLASDLGLFLFTLPWSLPFDGDGPLSRIRFFHREIYWALAVAMIAVNASLFFGAGWLVGRLWAALAR
jgi:hypothetical protein